MNMAPAPELLAYMSVAPDPELSFSEHGFGSGSGFYSFWLIISFKCIGVPEVEWKMNYTKYIKLREYAKLFWVI